MVYFDSISSETISLPENETIAETLENTLEDSSSQEILTQDSISSEDEETIDEQYVLKTDISSDDLDCSEDYLKKIIVNDSEAPSSVPEAYLKLHLLSYRLVKPNETKLHKLYGPSQSFWHGK